MESDLTRSICNSSRSDQQVKAEGAETGFVGMTFQRRIWDPVYPITKLIIMNYYIN